MAVGRISDYTGTVSSDGGRQITGGASLMANSALAKAGARIVERYDTSVSELELRYANNKLIGDATPGRASTHASATAATGFPISSATSISGSIMSMISPMRCQVMA